MPAIKPFFAMGYADDLGFGANMQFGVNIFHMCANRFIRTSDGVGNHFKTFAFDQLLEDFLFFWR